MRLVPAKWKIQKRGFRAKISKGYHIFDLDVDVSRPIDGPFDTKDQARKRIAELEQNRVSFQVPIADTTTPTFLVNGEGSSIMAEKTKETERTERTTETEIDRDPSDNNAEVDDNPSKIADEHAGETDGEDD